MNTQKLATAPCEEPKQSTKSSIDIEPSPMYNLTQSQKTYKKDLMRALSHEDTHKSTGRHLYCSIFGPNPPSHDTRETNLFIATPRHRMHISAPGL